MRRIVAMRAAIWFGEQPVQGFYHDVGEFLPRVKASVTDYLWEVKLGYETPDLAPAVMMQVLFDPTTYDASFLNMVPVADGSFDNMWPIFEAHVRMLL